MVKVKKAAHKANSTTSEPPKTGPSPIEDQARPEEEHGTAAPRVAGPPLGMQAPAQEQKPASEEAGPRPTAGAGSLVERMAALSSAAARSDMRMRKIGQCIQAHVHPIKKLQTEMSLCCC